MIDVIDKLSTPDSNKLVSVIIPVFNVRPYLVEALDSVLQQTYDNLEIIIIDDGSTDGSQEICDEYAAKDARVFVIHQENRGLSTARNVGLDRMLGKFIVFLDPDDTYHPDYVKAMMDAMLREKADLVICRYTVHNTTKKMRYTGKEIAEPSIEPGLYDRVQVMQAIADGRINNSVWNKLYKRELWNTFRFLDGHVYEDGEALFRINALSQRVYVLDVPLYFYRQRPGSITDTYSLDNINDWLLTQSRIDSFMEAHTPEIFSEKLRQKTKLARINGMIEFYIRLSKSDEHGKNALKDHLKKQTIQIVEENGIKNLGFRTKTAYRMLLYCPWLLKLAYPVYRSASLFLRRVAGR